MAIMNVGWGSFCPALDGVSVDRMGRSERDGVLEWHRQPGCSGYREDGGVCVVLAACPCDIF